MYPLSKQELLKEEYPAEISGEMAGFMQVGKSLPG